LGIESNGFHDWNNCPYISFDYDDHYKEINIPVLAFRTELYGTQTYGNYINGLATTDYTQIVLAKYGHLDAYVGPYSARDVSEPTYQWMLNHLLKGSLTASTTSMHVAYSIPVTVTVAGGPAPYSYQWNKGNAIMQGATGPQISVLEFTPGTYTFTCSVTDALGMTANTTALTFTVLPALPIPTPHANPTTQTKTTSTPTPTQTTPTTPTATPIQTVNPTDEPQTGNANNTTSYIIIAIAVVAIAALASAVIVAKRKKK
jgi:LPXTG-motif cell wall-anchored protein